MRREDIDDLLRAEVERTGSRYEAAKAGFTRVIAEIPSGLPHPDGTQRIQYAARELRASREAFQTALDRFNDFILRENLPDELAGEAAVKRRCAPFQKPSSTV